MLDAVPHLAQGQPVRGAGDDRHVVRSGQRLAELGQEVRGRLHSRPVVLVEDEQARTPAFLPLPVTDVKARRSTRLDAHGRGPAPALRRRPGLTSPCDPGPDDRPRRPRPGPAVPRRRPRPDGGVLAGGRRARPRSVVRLRRPSAAWPASRSTARRSTAPGLKAAVRPPRRGEPARRRPAARRPACASARALWVVSTSAAHGYGALRSGRAVRLLDRDRPGRRVGGPEAGPAGLAAARDPRQRPRPAPARAARPAGCRPGLRDLALEPRQRRPRGRSRRGARRHPADPRRPRRASRPHPTTSGGARSTSPVLAFVGRADDSRKNVRLLLDALPLMPGVRLLLIGSPPARAAPERVEATGVVPVGRPPPAPGDAVRRSRRTRRASGSSPPRRSPPASPSSRPPAAARRRS